jgi:hypothetical protein
VILPFNLLVINVPKKAWSRYGLYDNKTTNCRGMNETTVLIMTHRVVHYRCSGVNHCSFRLMSDYKVAEDWGPGVVFLKYACINRECSSF